MATLNLNKILRGFNYNGEFLTESNLIDLLEFSRDKFEDISELKDYLESDDISENINELSDSMVDIYYYDLRKWSVDNYNYIEDAVSEFGYDSKDFDFHKVISLAQYYAYNNEFYTLKNEFLDYLNDLKFIIKDWAGNIMFNSIEFDTFEEGWDYIYANVVDIDNVYEDLFVELQGDSK